MRMSDWSSDVCSSDRRSWEGVSGFGARFDEAGGNRLGRGLAAPEDELEHRVETLAFVYGGFDQYLRLVERQRAARAQQRAVAEQHDAAGRPEFEMAEPKLFVEIGRASCRERVCQYVEISVVAVSLKKKRKKGTNVST